MGFDTDLKDLGADVRGLSASLRAEGTPFDFNLFVIYLSIYCLSIYLSTNLSIRV